MEKATISPIDNDPIVEAELALLADKLGDDLPAYRNHIYRVLSYAMHFLGGDKKWQPTIAFALVYHDIGMWTDGDLAYLEPSERAAELALKKQGQALDAKLVQDIIHWHHKVTAYKGPHADVVNAVRKADWIDASQGQVRKGLTKAQIAAVNDAIPILGFPDVLMRLAADLNHGRKMGGLMKVLANVYKW